MPPNISRRTVLRGTGVAITLPYLESLVHRTARAQAVTAPKRLVALIHANGVPLRRYDGAALNVFYPQTTGTLPAVLPTCLEALNTQGVRGDVQLLSGIRHDADPAGVGGAHQHHTAARVLLGKNMESTDAALRASTLDVAVHGVIGAQASKSFRLTLGTAFQHADVSFSANHFDLGTDGKRAFLNSAGEAIVRADGGMNRSGSSAANVWQDASFNPRLVFNRLFCNGSDVCPGGGTLTQGSTTPPSDPNKARRLGVLHYVSQRVTQVKASLGARDKARLDEYLTGIEDLEKQVNAVSTGTTTPTGVQIPLRTEFRGMGASQNLLAKLMVDLIVKSFEANLVNVSTLMLGACDGANQNATSDLAPNLWDIGGLSVHDHAASHTTNGTATSVPFSVATKIAAAKVNVFAYLVKRLKEVDGEGGKLIDSTLAYYGSDFGDGHLHSVEDPFIFLAGKPGGIVTPGTYRRFDANGTRPRAAGVLVSVARAFGATLPHHASVGGLL